MKLVLCGVFFITHFTHVLLANEKACSLPLTDGEWEKYSPILVGNDSSVILPTRGAIRIKPKQTITVVCPDARNYLQNTQSNVTRGVCEHGDVVRVGNKNVEFNKLQCKKVIRGQVIETAAGCTSSSSNRLFKVGYNISKSSFYALIEICYDPRAGAAIYSRHLLHGPNLDSASKTNYRPTFSAEGANAIPFSVVYKQAFQKSTFNKLLKSSRLASEFINRKSYLARGHLSPDADFIIAPMQYSTYYYINTSPQWQSINGGNWKRIESMVRKSAKNTNDTYEIITGNYDLLKLVDESGSRVGIYLLSGTMVPVPKFVWKIVYSIRSQKAMVLIVLNNPFVDKATKNELLCNADICSEYGWGSSSWEDASKGFVHCCDFKQFSKQVQFVPKLTVTGNLYA